MFVRGKGGTEREVPIPSEDRRDTGGPCSAAVGRSGSPASPPVIDDGWRH